MLVVEVDGFDPQTFQGTFHAPPDHFRTAIGCWCHSIDRDTELRGNHNVLVSLQGLADQFLVHIRAITFSCVEETVADVIGVAYGIDACRFIDRFPIGMGEAYAAKTKGGDLQVPAKDTLVHMRLSHGSSCR